MGCFLWLASGSPEDGHNRQRSGRQTDVLSDTRMRQDNACDMGTACSEVRLHPAPGPAHLQDSELPAFVRPAGRSREKVHSDWPHVPCLWPLCGSLGPWKCAWNKPPGPGWSRSASPTPHHPGFTSPGAHSGLRLFLGWEGRLAVGHLCPPASVPQLFLVLMKPFSSVPPVGKPRPGNYLRRPGSGEDSPWGVRLVPTASSPSHSAPTFPIPRGPQKHTLTPPAASLRSGSSLVPEAAMDPLSIVLTQGFM